jgi:hypothetical protein
MGRGKPHFLLLSLLLAAVFWVLESLIHAYAFHADGDTFVLIPGDPNELWMRLVICGLIVLFGIYADHAVARLRESQQQSERLRARLEDSLTKVLSGFVPICAYCKKIREEGLDARNEASWVEIESFLSQRSDLQFTHGLCPGCLGTLYGGRLRGLKPPPGSEAS